MSSLRPPLAGLAEVAGTDAALGQVRELLGRSSVHLVAPAAIRPFAAATIAAQRPVVVVTATGREADDLTVELAEILGDQVALFPSWETLPHERLSPSADTVGRRLRVLRRLAHPDDRDHTEPLRVVVTTVRSLVQPMAAGLGDIEPVRLRVGAELDFDELTTRLVEFAYERVDMVGKRGEFAVRGGILDIFPPTADHPVRVEFWGDEISELRAFSVADQRSLAEVDPGPVVAPPCRELLLTQELRDTAARVAADNPADAALVEMLDKLAQGIPVEGMEALLPVLRPGDLQ
ncbi:MAG: transcription-repair coupling factor, partial [Nocardia sp.]|nr:transcription-repair coupling factor [Nocardia sp.]